MIKSRATTISREEWVNICNYLQGFKDIPHRICFGCGTAMVYDNLGNRYSITRRSHNLDTVKKMVEVIIKINAASN